tara:strand:- start:2567 stop:2830 length:264 start_codon:yes stop_codon:yes gene_type:complete
MADTTEQISIDLAVYMERLDTYIATQSQLNETLCSRLERLDSELDDLRDWRSRFYGAKSLMFMMGVLLAHGAAVIAAMVAVSNIMRD